MVFQLKNIDEIDAIMMGNDDAPVGAVHQWKGDTIASNDLRQLAKAIRERIAGHKTTFRIVN